MFRSDLLTPDITDDVQQYLKYINKTVKQMYKLKHIYKNVDEKIIRRNKIAQCGITSFNQRLSPLLSRTNASNEV